MVSSPVSRARKKRHVLEARETGKKSFAIDKDIGWSWQFS
jgi:hypothetical protein